MPTGEWQILIISPSRKIIGELNPLLSSELPDCPLIEFEGYPNARTLTEIQNSGMGNLCFLDATSDPEAAVTAIASLHRVKPDLPLVALVDNANASVLLQCMRQGAADFLTRPFAADQLRGVVAKLAKTSPGLVTDRGRITAVIPVKGACGASTLACNLAAQVKRLSGSKVLLADLDPVTGTVSFILKLKSNYSFLEALHSEGDLDLDIWKGLIANAQGLDVLLPPENPMDGLGDLFDARPVIYFAAKMYDHVIIDVGSVYGPWALSIARTADEILLVTTNELPALQSALRAMGYLNAEGIAASKLRVVVNRFNADVGLSKEMIETALHHQVYHLVPSDYETVQRALLDGKPIAGSTTFGKSLIQLAEKVGGVKKEAAAKKKSTGGLSQLLNIFSRS